MSDQPKVPAEMQKRLAELRQKKAKKEAAREDRAAADELVELELEEKFEKELGGERGVVFEIIGTPDGHVVVKLGEWVAYKRFTLAKRVNDLPTPEDIISFVESNRVYPDREKFMAIVNKYGAVATRCASAITTMHQGRRKEDEGKY